MRAVAVALASTLIPSLAAAEDVSNSEPTVTPVFEKDPQMVIGGTNAPADKWPDCGAMLFSGQQACTGTLIAPTVVLTAGHCNDPALTKVLLGTNDLRNGGEEINVAKRVELQQNDTTVLILAKPSTVKPRALGTGWVKFDIKNGAAVQLVGFGTTNSSGSTPTNTLKEAPTTITDFDCSVMPGCSNFEIGAGGNGIDTCPGDSGGPMYLTTSYGDFLIGVTSRAYGNATRACGDGGIYGRPDLIVDFIEAAAGVPVTRGPEPTLDAPLLGIRGDAAEAVIVHNDPKAGTSHKFEIAMQPMKGQAAVSADGVLRVCVAPDGVPGDTDSVVVKVTDTADPNRSVTQRFKLSVAANEPASGTCDPQAFGSGDEGGCCDSGGRGAGGSALLSVIALVVLRRRRR